METAITDRPVKTDPTPDPQTVGERVRTACLVLIALCVVGATLYFLRPILTPLFIALFLFFLLKPVTGTVARWKIPYWVAYPVLCALLILVLLAVGNMVSSNARSFDKRWPEYQERLLSVVDAYARLTGHADDKGSFDWEKQSLQELLNFSYGDVFKKAAEQTLGFAEVAVLALFYLFFLFMEANKLPQRLRRALKPEAAERAQQVLKNIDDGIKGYLLVKTGISLGLGITTGLLCYLFGVDFWPLWAVLMFLANYITYVGSIAALVPPIALAYLQLSPLTATAFAAVLVGARFVWIDFLEIRFSGRQLNISPVLLLLSLAVFGLLWGVVGMVLAVPIITAVKIILLNFESTRHLAILGSEE
jgi:AI-2 transport protein TqsA